MPFPVYLSCPIPELFLKYLIFLCLSFVFACQFLGPVLFIFMILFLFSYFALTYNPWGKFKINQHTEVVLLTSSACVWIWAQPQWFCFLHLNHSNLHVPWQISEDKPNIDSSKQNKWLPRLGEGDTAVPDYFAYFYSHFCGTDCLPLHWALYDMLCLWLYASSWE